MSGNKLNQSLDDIVGQRRQLVRHGRPARRPRAGAKVVATPVGGVRKNTKTVKAAEKAIAPTGPSKSGEGKIIVSNLPQDVSETQIKDYFHSTIGLVKKVLLTYGPNGQSRGVATVIFSKHDSAVKAAKDLDGLKVDKRPMKIELIMGAKEVPDPVPAKSLGDRIDKPKSAVKAQPKPATTAKPVSKGSGRRGGRPGRGRNAGRGKPKTAEELDAEMVDYFGPETNGPNGDATMTTNGGAVQPVPNGDSGMDEIM